MLAATQFRMGRRAHGRQRLPLATALLSVGLLAGCATGGNLSGGAVGGSAPTTEANPVAEGRGSPTGIGGQIWQDGNGNGTQDGVESGQSGLSLTLWLDSNRDGACSAGTDTAFSSAQSGADGSYRFDNVPAGSYCVELSGAKVPVGWTSNMSAPQVVGVTGVTLNIGLP